MKYRKFETQTGTFVLMQGGKGEIRTSWLTSQLTRQLKTAQRDSQLLPSLSKQLEQYFQGKVVDFSDAILPDGGAFHRACWDACRRIPRGETRTYAQLARLAGSPNAARAAGQAMRNNPIPVITPCHRVIGSSGKLHGFGGSLNRRGQQLAIKATLLRMEGVAVDPQ